MDHAHSSQRRVTLAAAISGGLHIARFEEGWLGRGSGYAVESSRGNVAPDITASTSLICSEGSGLLSRERARKEIFEGLKAFHLHGLSIHGYLAHTQQPPPLGPP